MADEHQGFLNDPREGTERIDADPARVFISYKESVTCLQFDCPECGANFHVDTDFAYILRCKCGAAYEMPSLLYPRRVEVTDGGPVFDLESGESAPLAQFEEGEQ